MPFTRIIEQIGYDFIEAWNSNDKPKILTFFSTNAIYQCQCISQFYPENKNNTILGKKSIDEYFTDLFKNNFPKLILDNFKSNARNFTLNCHYVLTNEKIIIEFQIDNYGKIVSLDSRDNK